MRLIKLAPAVLTLALFSASCGGGGETGGGGTTPVTPTTPVVTTVLLTPTLPQVEINTTVTIAVDIRDQLGNVISGKTVNWTTSNAAVATVDASGAVRGVSLGTATITATVDGKSGTAVATVTPPAVASVAIGAFTTPLIAGASAPLVVTLKDRNGATLSGRVVTYASSNTRVATVDANGVVTALTAGTVTITATSEGVSATTTIVISAPAGTTAPTVTGVSPATLTPGVLATISGANLITPGTQPAVYIAGVQATVTSATTSQLQVQVPTANLPCQSTQAVNVEVTTVAGTATARQSLAVATQRTLAVGASFLATANGGIVCNELPANGTYLVSVFNASKSLNQTAGFELKGAAGGVSSSRIAPSVVQPTLIPAVAGTHTAINPAVDAEEHAHLQRLQADMDLIRQLGSPNRYRTRVAQSRIAAPGSGASFSAAPVPTTVGQNAQLNFHFNGCSLASSTPVTARVVYVGPKAIVLEDNAGPLAGKIDNDMISLAQEFETVSFPLLQQNFGNPLAYDDSTDHNGRIIMLFTPQVNNQSANLLGFVSSCDFFPPSVATSVGASNQAEIFYARAVTDTSAGSTSLNGRPQWKRQMPGTLIHETKHITAFAERFATPLQAVFEQVWLEEATAQMASEFYARSLHGNSWRSNSTYFGTLDCEVRPSTNGCGGGIFVMGNHFGFLSDFLQNFESKTILSATDDNDIYGSSWMFARWLTDTYGGTSEGSFIRSVVLNFTQNGVDNVTAATGKTWPELLSQFTLMLAADDVAGVTSPYTEQSWNLPGIFAGYNTDFPSSRPKTPLAVRQTGFGAFTANIASLKGGGAMLMQISGANGGATTQLLDLHSASGAVLPAGSTVGISVLRIQ